jgi:hypothetical protein
MSLEQQVIDADEAKRLVEHPLLKEAFEGVKAGIINAMQNAPMGDEKTHNRLVISLQVLSQIEKNITEKIQTGKLAEIEIQETLAQKVRRFARY